MRTIFLKIQNAVRRQTTENLTTLLPLPDFNINRTDFFIKIKQRQSPCPKGQHGTGRQTDYSKSPATTRKKGEKNESRKRKQEMEHGKKQQRI